MNAGSESSPPADALEGTRVPLTRMRRGIARAMSASAAIPQFQLERSVGVSGIAARQAELAATGMPTSLQDFIGLACVEALHDHVYLNASFDGDAIVLHDRVHLGVAIALDGGLISPAIRDADRRSLSEFAAERVRLRDGARAGHLSGAELYGATFTISNLGPLGIERFTALVIPGQSAIVAIGSIGHDTPAAAATLTISCDHRVVDGAPAAAFLRDVSDRLQSRVWLTALR